MIPNKKSSILLVLKVLEEYSDEEHYLTQKEIIEKIYQEYDIELERKSIASSLELLEELDYDIARGPNGGSALLSRTLDKTEVTYLVDAIFSSKSIDGKLAKKIADSISSCLSRYERKDYSYIYKSTEITRTSNKELMYNISVINEAMKQSKRISFKYLTYDENGNEKLRNNGYEYIVSPYYLVNNFGRYYLLCNYREKYRPLQIFRLDNMVKVVIKDDWPIKPLSSLKDAPIDFSISKYINEHIYMYDGVTIEATIKLDSKEIVNHVKDWFGSSSKIKNVNGEILAIIKCNETALMYWVMQYCDCITVKSPESFRIKIKNNIERAYERYLNYEQ